MEICFGIAYWQISSNFDRDICPRRYNGGVLSFQVLFSVDFKIVNKIKI